MDYITNDGTLKMLDIKSLVKFIKDNTTTIKNINSTNLFDFKSKYLFSQKDKSKNDKMELDLEMDSDIEDIDLIKESIQGVNVEILETKINDKKSLILYNDYFGVNFFDQIYVKKTDVTSITTDSNLSLYRSIISGLDTEFNNLSYNEQTKKLKAFVEFAKRDLGSEGFTEYGYSKLKWTKKMFQDALTQLQNSALEFKYLNDYLHLNIFVMDGEKYIFEFMGGTFNKFKKNLLLYKINSMFYLITNKSDSTFSSNDKIIQYILKKNKINQNVEEDLLKYQKKKSRYSQLKIIVEPKEEKEVCAKVVIKGMDDEEEDITVNKFDEESETNKINKDDKKVKLKQNKYVINKNLSDSDKSESDDDCDESDFEEDIKPKNKIQTKSQNKPASKAILELEKLSLKELQQLAITKDIATKKGKILKNKGELINEISKS